jgi:hypothetical protein
MIKKTVKFFDKLEDKVRAFLSRWPIVYTFIGGVAIVLFWRGVWMTADSIPFLNGPISVILSIAILLITGLFVSFFIGENIIISGIKRDKKLFERAEIEIQAEAEKISKLEEMLDHLDQDIHNLKKLQNLKG